MAEDVLRYLRMLFSSKRINQGKAALTASLPEW